MKPESQYAPLPLDDDESTPFRDGLESPKSPSSPPPTPSRPTASNRLIAFATLASIVVCVLNIGLVATTPRAQRLSIFKPLPDRALARPSVYIGLDKLPQEMLKAALPKELEVFPPVFHPVDSARPNHVFPDDGHAHFTFNGQVQPGDHHVLLSSNTSMIAQYRVHDYGMERCAIAARIPSLEALQAKNTTVHLHSPITFLEIWNLTTTNEINVRELSYNTKPQRSHMLGRVRVAVDHSFRTGDFWCGPAGSLQSFEVACATEQECHLDFWQNYYFKPRLGIYVSQQPSL